VARLDAGDPHGEVTTPLQIASPILMTRHRGTCAAELIAALRQCPILEPVRWQHLARWRAELAARFDQSAVSTGPSENFNVKIKNTELKAPRLPDFDNCRLLPNHARTREDRLGRESEPAPGSLRRETLVGEGAWDSCLSVEAWQSRSDVHRLVRAKGWIVFASPGRSPVLRLLTSGRRDGPAARFLALRPAYRARPRSRQCP